MTNDEIKKMTDFDYGYNLGFRDGKVSRQRIIEGEHLEHGNLLSANDPYSIGYRGGLNGLKPCNK
jgi:hypothetical protein